MPDNAQQGLISVAADELTTVNGVAQVEPLPKAQRVKPGYGLDGEIQDVDPAHPLPTTDDGLGADGDTPPALATNARGVRGWLRGIYEKLAGTLTVGGTVAVSSVPEVEVKNDAGNPLAASIAALTDGTAQFKFAPPASGTTANVASSTSSGTLAAANPARRGLYVFNDSTANLFLKLGATASASSFTVKIPAGGFYELPVPFYRGVVDGIWDAANGNARVTELS